ncbi:MAG TPA: alpha/beta fold hydrolase [Nocardioidaceae bacterium]|nr:alpha/beta fold hydrolase [Nocardioidaceae bacterium]
MLNALAPARRRFVLGATALAIAAVIVGAAAIVARSNRTAAADPVNQQKPGPVLLVPGYGGSEAALRQLEVTLSQHGRTASVVHLAGDGTGDLRSQVPVLDRAVRAALRQSGASSVDVIGYSAGGVIARLWVADGGASLARRVVMLGTPNHGTDLAGLASSVVPDFCPSACQQLAPDSDLIRRLNAGDETPSGPSWVSVWSDDDRVVFPPDSASLDGALDISIQSVCGNVGDVSHGDLPTDGAVVSLVLDLLGPGPPVMPTSADC